MDDDGDAIDGDGGGGGGGDDGLLLRTRAAEERKRRRGVSKREMQTLLVACASVDRSIDQ